MEEGPDGCREPRDIGIFSCNSNKSFRQTLEFEVPSGFRGRRCGLHLNQLKYTKNMSAHTMPEVGSPAPAFSGQTQGGDALSLSDFRGQKVVLYFYPKDDTPGCTRQACNLRDHWSTLQEAGFAVIGVSKDTVASHDKFANKYELPFPLVADPDLTILNAYGTYGEKNRYGRKFMGVKRTTFLIDEAGIVRHVFKRPKVDAHTEEILTRWQKLQA